MKRKDCNGGGHLARTDIGELLSYLRVMQMEEEEEWEKLD
jgi:hypothetical protein